MSVIWHFTDGAVPSDRVSDFRHSHKRNFRKSCFTVANESEFGLYLQRWFTFQRLVVNLGFGIVDLPLLVMTVAGVVTVAGVRTTSSASTIGTTSPGKSVGVPGAPTGLLRCL